MSPHLSVVIPTLNEIDTIAKLLSQLQQQQAVYLDIIVADGGSIDGTLGCLASFAGINVINSEKGRAKQLNAGQRLAKAPYLLFLHADSELTSPNQLSDALFMLQAAESKATDNYIAGHFPLRFHDHDESPSRYRYLETKTYLNRENTTNGDQGMLCSQLVFKELGGFNETWGFLEDQAFAEQLRNYPKGRWITLPDCLSTSARRFEVEGFSRRYFLMSIMMALYMIGFHQFFHRAPEVYREQGDSTKLLLTPFFRLIGTLMGEKSVLERIKIWCRVGAYIANNGWQAWLLPQAMVGRSKLKACASLAWYDRWLAPLIKLPLWWPVIGFFVWLWAFVFLRLWYRLVESKFLRS